MVKNWECEKQVGSWKNDGTCRTSMRWVGNIWKKHVQQLQDLGNDLFDGRELWGMSDVFCYKVNVGSGFTNKNCRNSFIFQVSVFRNHIRFSHAVIQNMGMSEQSA